QNGSPYGYGHGLVLGNTEFADDGIGHQGMGGEHTGREQAGIEIVAQKVTADRITDGQGNGKGEKSKEQALVAVGLEFVHVEFQPGDEHDIEQAYGGEQVHGGTL